MVYTFTNICKRDGPRGDQQTDQTNICSLDGNIKTYALKRVLLFILPVIYFGLIIKDVILLIQINLKSGPDKVT